MVELKRREFIQYSGAAALLTAVPMAARAQAIPSATIQGPIPVVPKTNEPFRGQNEQPVAGPGLPPPLLIPFDYVEEEYFVSGTANGMPYTTSLLVRKPRDPKKFSGLVAFETIHAQGAIPFWGAGRELFMPNGHAWVAVASQRGVIENFSKKQNPARYASLNVPTGAPPAAPAAAAGAAGGRGAAMAAGSSISNAIQAQVGAMLKDNLPNGPLKGMRVRWLIMGGSSQTGGTTLNFISQAHDGARRPDGKPIFDGYFPTLAVGAPTAAGSPIIHVLSEAEAMGAATRPGATRADSDTPNDRYRLYELTGSSHVVTRGVTDPVKVFSTLEGALRPGEILNQFPNSPFFTAFLTHLINWVTKGTVPPKAGRLEAKDNMVVRDEFGNAKGGIRTPYVDMPTVTYYARAASAPAPAGAPPIPAAAASARGLIGLQVPIPKEKLVAMYGSRAAYLKRFNQQIDKLVADRFLLPAGGKLLKEEEAKNPPI